MWKKINEEIFILVLILVSLYGIFVSSSEPLISILKGTFVESFSVTAISGNEIIFTISSGFFVSTIFYVMVVYIPEKRRKITIRPIINRLIEDIIDKGGSVVDTMDQHAPSALKFKKNNDYSLNALKTACGTIKSRQLIDTSGALPANVNCSVGAQLCYRENIAKEHRAKILPYLQYIDEKVVQEVDKLDSSDFCALVTYFATPNFSPESFEILGDAIFEYHKQIESVAKAYKDKINPKYSNVRYSI